MIGGTVTLPSMAGEEISPGVWLINEPAVRDGRLVALANVGGALAVVELRISFPTQRKEG